MDSHVFSRSAVASNQISPALYNLTIGLTLCWGFFVNWLIIQTVPVEMFYTIPHGVFFIAFFACCMGGSWIMQRSDNPIISLLGYHLIVIPFGIVVSMTVGMYEPGLVLEAMRVTGEITFVMMLLGTMYPAFFMSIGRGLFIALLVTISVELIDMFILHKNSGIYDWVIVVIFSGYIGYDWARANAVAKTVDNAIDSAAALYMDIINLFLRVLRILSRR